MYRLHSHQRTSGWWIITRVVLSGIFFCSLFIVHCSFVSAAPLPFSDLGSTTPYLSDIMALYEKGMVVGYSDGTFRPDGNITRAEFAKLVLAAGRCMDCERPPTGLRSEFSDRPFPDVATSTWYFICVSLAKRLGLVTGYLGGNERGLFLPDAPISRAESIAVLLRASGIPTQGPTLFEFLDVPPGAWYEPYLQVAVTMNLIPFERGSVYPNLHMRRGEFAHLANLVLAQQVCPKLLDGTGDEDGDGALTVDDRCPVAAGPVANGGCPVEVDSSLVNTESDQDGDGVLDRSDRCIDVYGLRELEGCPQEQGPIPQASEGDDTSENSNANEGDNKDNGGNQNGRTQGSPPPRPSLSPSPVSLPALSPSPSFRFSPIPSFTSSPTPPSPPSSGEDTSQGTDGDENQRPTPTPLPPLDRDGDGVYDRDDWCILTPGLASRHGCPAIPGDADGDGLIDAEDRCPRQFGLASNDGCPPDIVPDTVTDDRDQDGDGVLDRDDRCIRVYGSPLAQGCPLDRDQDGDGILDDQDRCVPDMGPLANQGCPIVPGDADGDGVTDPNDRCPLQFGLVSNQGCPADVDGNGVTDDSDQDGDGIVDGRDACVTVPGYPEYQGCLPSDRDGDTVTDPSDVCIIIPGRPDRQGCPDDIDPDVITDTTDMDGDGVVDREDKCITTPGIRAHMGCSSEGGTGPDRDGDGVPDTRDLCPDLPATLRNATPQNGCPFVKRPDPSDDRDIGTPPCRQCPCPSVDAAADVQSGDVIFGAITDEENTRIYGRSNMRVVR